MLIILIKGMAGMSPRGMLDPAAAKGETSDFFFNLEPFQTR